MKGVRAVLALTMLGLSACSVDAEVREYCEFRDSCNCDDAGTCCITEGHACFEGQCCAGLVCNWDSRCVPQS